MGRGEKRRPDKRNNVKPTTQQSQEPKEEIKIDEKAHPIKVTEKKTS